MDNNKQQTAKPVINNATGDWAPNPHTTMVQLTPIEERIRAERPELAEGLTKLREILGEDVYQKRISSLVNITRSGETMMVVTSSFMERSMLERDCIPAFKEAFGVSKVRVVV
ncbi:MAG: RNA helicase [Selenomonadaceae bacterium]|nr:RNA helicase [Selenomonadaceae bacterium]